MMSNNMYISFKDYEQMLHKVYGNEYKIQSDSMQSYGFWMTATYPDGTQSFLDDGFDEDYDDIACMLNVQEILDIHCYGGGKICIKHKPLSEEYLLDHIAGEYEFPVKKTDKEGRAENVAKLKVGDFIRIIPILEHGVTLDIQSVNGESLGRFDPYDICELKNYIFNENVTVRNARVSSVKAFTKAGKLMQRPTLTIRFELRFNKVES